MKNARTVLRVFSLALSLYLAAAYFLESEVQAAAGGIQSCTVGSTCKVGEFLYDDTSTPISGASCTITSKYPDNSSFLSSQAMSGGGADGWYYHEFTTPSTTGVYPTSVCCTTSGDTLCIDKGFESKAASATDTASIASAVWSYSSRTVSSFGTLISDIWNNATRTITGAGLSSGQLATQDDVVSVRNNVNTLQDTVDNLSETNGDLTSIEKKVDENRILLEKIVNKPIIENVLEDTTPDLTQKIKDSRAVANQLFVNNQFLTAQSALLSSKLSGLSGRDTLNFVISLSGIVGEPSDTSSANTMFGQVNFLRDSWNWEEADLLQTKLTSVQKSLSDLQSGLVDYEKTPQMAFTVKQVVKDSLAFEKVVGTTVDKEGKKTVFSRLLYTEGLVAKLDERGKQAQLVLGEYTKTKDDATAISKISDLKAQVIAINKVPSVASSLVAVKLDGEKSIKNSLLGLIGVVNSNKKLLALGSGETLVNTWLELGSIVFKTIATNPSTLISQDVEIKYYLPKEIRQEDVIKTDAGLEAKYDAEKDQMFVQGKFNLKPGQTRTFEIETKDIWEVTPQEIASFRSEINDLFKPLEKTAFFAQGISLKSDALASLDQIEALQANAITPEDKIRSYREADILKNSVETKVAGLRDLVAQASSAGSMLGFVGGSQTIAVWGMIIMVVAGFVVLLTYMKSLMSPKKVQKVKEEKSDVVKAEKPVSANHGKKGLHPFGFAAIVIATSAVTAGATTYLVTKSVSQTYEAKLKVLGEQTEKKESEEKINYATPDASPAPESFGVGGQYTVVVNDTPTGYLKVRSSPGGVEIGHVIPGDKLMYISENTDWYQVELKSGDTGWISKKYSVME